MRPRGLLLAVGLFAAAAAAAGFAADGSLSGSVGPGFTIRLLGADGLPVQHLDPGTYSLTVDDRSPDHNLHLRGPGVDVATEVDAVGTSMFTVTVRDGRYQYLCDAHPATMAGTVDVGAGEPPPPRPKPVTLNATVGPRATISLTTAAGARVRILGRGAYAITVRDRSKEQNFHLSGVGVNRRTGLVQTGTVTWRLTLRAGRLLYLSDASPKTLRGSATVR